MRFGSARTCSSNLLRPGAPRSPPDAPDDALARLIAVFGDRGLFARPKILLHTWGNEETVGIDFPSRVSDKLPIIVLRNRTDPPDTWVTEERDLLADFHAAFGEAPDPVTAIGFMSAKENLPTEGISLLDPVVWEPAGQPLGPAQRTPFSTSGPRYARTRGRIALLPVRHGGV